MTVLLLCVDEDSESNPEDQIKEDADKFRLNLRFVIRVETFEIHYTVWAQKSKINDFSYYKKKAL